MLWTARKFLELCLLLHLLAGTWIEAQSRHIASDAHLPMAHALPCQGHNQRLSNFLRAALEESGHTLLPHAATSLEEFAVEVKAALDRNILPKRPIEYLFSEAAPFNPTCAGIWAEFGVASGGTINLAADFRRAHCSSSCPSVHGFDTFTGLPEPWLRDDEGLWEKGGFDQGGAEGHFPAVRSNANLIKGLFNVSLPQFLEVQAVYSGLDDPVSFLHIDCDLYAGARDAFHFLAPRLVVGTVIVLDDLINYQYYMEHELKAIWEWLVDSGAKLLPLGAMELPGTGVAMELDWSPHSGRPLAAEWLNQNAAFVIAQIDPPRKGT